MNCDLMAGEFINGGPHTHDISSKPGDRENQLIQPNVALFDPMPLPFGELQNDWHGRQ